MMSYMQLNTFFEHSEFFPYRGVTVGPPGAPDLAVYNDEKGDVNLDILG